MPDNGALLLNGTALNIGDTIDSAALDAGGLAYQPPLNVSANNSAQNGFSFTVTDDGGTALGGENISSEAQTISFDLTPVNDAPVLISNEATVAEGGTVVIAVSYTHLTLPTILLV